MKGKIGVLALVLWAGTVGLKASPGVKFQLNNFCLGAPLLIDFEGIDVDTVLWQADCPGVFKLVGQGDTVAFLPSEPTEGIKEVSVTATAVNGVDRSSVTQRCWGIPIPFVDWRLNGVNLLRHDTALDDTFHLPLCYLPAKRYLVFSCSDWSQVDSFYGMAEGKVYKKNRLLYSFTQEGKSRFEVSIRFKKGCTATYRRTAHVEYLGDDFQNEKPGVLITTSGEGDFTIVKATSQEDVPFTYEIFSLEGALLARSDTRQSHHCARLVGIPYNKAIVVLARFEDGTTEAIKRFIW